jgi:Resolvase, N terminal domain
MESTRTFCKHLLTGAREVMVLQLLLFSPVRTEEELVPVDEAVRAELVRLMARILMTVFQTEVRRTDERVSIQSQEIKPEHLLRKAIVYLRQSSEKQVRQNIESQQLQYELAEHIRGLGWQEIEITNSDLGFSAAMGSASREGFERVLTPVALGEVGILDSREVSRLSRTDKDWCRLFEVCQIFGTLIGKSNRSTI